MNNTEQTPTNVSATEWLRKEKDKERTGTATDWIMWALGLAEHIAQRCDAAESRNEAAKQLVGKIRKEARGYAGQVEEYVAQLAAAQAEAAALRVSWQNAEATIKQLEERLNEEISHSKAY